ncbi:NTP transferase domain-containing protein [Candidatus Woesearchaeota archaeon]|nr:NTP transferase domain-containing protein [Candidatus Woesearchaeota archaeon]
MVKKAVIMAAGKGTRMLPLTKTTPKVLIDINGKPFLHYVIANLKKSGFEEFGIIAGYLREKVEEFVKQNNINATIIEQKEQMGTGHAVMQAKEFTGDDPFIVLGGDNLFSVDDLKSINKDDKLCYVIGKQMQGDISRYGVFRINDSMLEKIEEKPKIPPSDIINIGLYKFTPDIWPALDSIELSERGEYELTDAVNILAEKGKVKALKLEDYWLDLGCKEDIPKVESFIKESY